EAAWPDLEVAGGGRYLRLLGDRRATPRIGRPVRDRGAELDRWAGVLLAAGPDRPPPAAFANNRFEGAGFVTAAALRRRLGQPAVEPEERWPNPPIPGLGPAWE